jgi:GT2 family glycosyltransferase
MNESIELAVRPMQQLTAIGDAGAHTWRAVGNDAAFACLIGTESIPAGWYVLELEMGVTKGRACNPCLYPDYGVGIFEHHKIDLPVDVKSGERFKGSTTVMFHRDVKGLRFDPTVVPAEFDIAPLKLRRIGKLAAARRLFLAGWRARATGLSKTRFLLGGLLRALMRGPRGFGDFLYGELKRAAVPQDGLNYAVWLDFYDSPDSMRDEEAAKTLESLDDRPLVSVIVPAYNTPERWLRRCIESVQAQAYPEWELCIADDASTQPHVRRILAEYAAADPRIRYVVRSENGHIAEASNSALEIARGEYVALLDHDDELHPLALLECVSAFQRNPDWQMLFTDEDKIDEQGVRSDPYFKSDWNPDLFFSQNCVCHLTVYKRQLVEGVGRFRKGTEGAQDWDLTLRVIEQLQPKQIGHVPKVLYHWRMISGSTALAPGEKSYAHLAALHALDEYFGRNAINAEVLEMPGYSGYFRISYRIPEPAPMVSLLIPTRDRVDLLRRCVGSILKKTTYPNYEIIILDNESREQKTLDYLEEVKADSRVRVVRWPHPFNYSAINNFGAAQARGEVIGLLNNDIEVITPGWLTEMVGHALRPEIGVVGAMLYYPNDTIQHAGVVLGIGGVAGHVHVGAPRGYPGLRHRAGLAQTLSAVTAACVLMRASIFREVGGLDEQLRVAFNDIDLCLRVREKGYRNLWTPFAELYHYESATRGYENTPEKIERFKQEESFMKRRWKDALDTDPYYNPNFTLRGTPFTLAYPPRLKS